MRSTEYFGHSSIYFQWVSDFIFRAVVEADLSSSDDLPTPQELHSHWKLLSFTLQSLERFRS